MDAILRVESYCRDVTETSRNDSGTQGYNNVPPQGPVFSWGLSLAPREPYLW